MTEAEHARVILEFLTEQGWDVYPEVEAWDGSGDRPDMVAVNGKLIWVIEVKKSPSLALLHQGYRWLNRAHYVSIAAPGLSDPHSQYLRRHKAHRGWRCAQLAHRLGIGTIDPVEIERLRGFHENNRQWRAKLLEDEIDNTLRVQQGAFTRLRKERVAELLDFLHPDMKNYAPGTSGTYSTLWGRTARRMIEVLKENPGATLRYLMGELGTHYSPSSMRSLLDRDPDVVVMTTTTPYRYWHKESLGVMNDPA